MPAPVIRTHGALSACILLGLTFILSASFAALEDERPDQAKLDDKPGYEANFHLLQQQRVLELFTAILAGLNFVMCLIVTGIRRHYRCERLLPPSVVILSLILVFAEFGMTLRNMALPTNPRVALGATLLGALFCNMAMLVLLLRETSCCAAPKVMVTRSILEGALGKRQIPIDTYEEEPTVTSLREAVETRDARETLFRAFIRSRWILLFVCSTILAVAIVNVIKETTVFESRQPAFFNIEDIKAMDKLGDVSSLYEQYKKSPPKGPLNPPKRVLLFVLDGLRNDFVDSNPDFSGMITHPDFARDAVRLESRNGLPSMSNPNWVTILTGAYPEIHGTMGNLFAKQVPFDNIFSEAAKNNLTQGITGSPDFATLVEQHLPLLIGDGTVSPYITADGSSQMKTAELADKLRFGAVSRAMDGSVATYDFFLCHFSNIDIQGHNYGATKKWNKHDTYNKAVSTVAGYIESIRALLDEDTLMVISSDHGHVDSGGHGGVREVLRNVPLILYQRGSNLGSGDTPHAPVRNVDISPSICAALGIPLPRQSIGTIIPAIFNMLSASRQELVMRDLLHQKITFVKAVLAKLGSPSRSERLQEVFDAEEDPKTIEEYQAAVQTILDEYGSYRSRSLSLKLRRNVTLSAMCALVVILVLLLISHNWSFARPFSILYRTANVSATAQAMNVHAFLLAFLHCICHYALCIIALVLWASSHDYPWDSTMVHDLPHFIKWVLYVLGVGIAVEYLLTRAYHIRYSDRPKDPYAEEPRLGLTIPGSPGSPTSPTTSRPTSPDVNEPLALLEPSQAELVWRKVMHIGRLLHHYLWSCVPETAQWDKIYLIRWYTVMLSSTCIMIVVVLQTNLAFLNPFGMQLEWITPSGWGFRFRMLCVQYFSVPLLCGSVAVMWLFPRHDNSSTKMDALYILGIDKFLKGMTPREEPLLSF